MRDKSGLFRFAILYIFAFLSVGYAVEERPINFEIFPWHIEVEVMGITDEAFREVFVGEGTSEWLNFSLPEGEYRYTARLDGFYNEGGTLSIPGPDETPSVTLTEKTQLATLLDTNSNIAGEEPLVFFVLLFSALTLTVSAVWGVVWRGLGAMWCDFAAYCREERWKKYPYPVSQELALKNGAALIVAVLVALAFYLISISREPNPNTPTYEERIIAALLLGIPLYNFIRLVTLSVQTLSVQTLSAPPLRRIWGRINQELTSELGDVWRYKQPDPRNYKRLAMKSQRTNKVYQVAVSYAKGKVSKDTQAHQLLGGTAKFSDQLNIECRELRKISKSVKAEASILFLPNATADRFGSIKADDNVFIGNGILVVCGSLNDLIACLIDPEEANRNSIAPQENGVEVEKEAVKTLVKLKPKGWKVRRGWWFYLGDIDARLVIPEKQDIVIEIKNYRQHPCVRNGELVRSDGTSMTREVAQVQRNAQRYRAKAVLWLPKANFRSFYFENVLVVGGHARTLYPELGAPNAQSSGDSSVTS